MYADGPLDRPAERRDAPRSAPTVGILHFTCPPIVGGVELLMRQHAELLLEHGCQVRVLAGRGGRFHRRVPVTLIPALDSKHPALTEVNQQLRDGVVSAAFEALVDGLMTRLRPAFEGLDVCIIHNALTLHFNLPLTVALRRLLEAGSSPRLIAWCHDLSWTNPLYIPLMRDREPWSLLATRLPGVRYVVVSGDRRRDLLRLWQGERAGAVGGPDDPVVIPAGVSPRTKLRLRAATVALVRQLRLDEGWPFLLLPARITKRKNIEYAIRVTRALRDLGLNPRLLVTGPPGPHNVRSVDYVDEIQAERARLGVRDEVVFLYEQRRPDGRPWRATDAMMDDLYQMADLLLFPSAQEGFGIPLLEAGLVRLPIFCSDIPPFREIAGDAAHFFDLDAPPAETAARIAAALATDPAARLRRAVLQRFTWEHVFRERIAPLLEPAAPVASTSDGGRAAGSAPSASIPVAPAPVELGHGDPDPAVLLPAAMAERNRAASGMADSERADAD